MRVWMWLLKLVGELPAVLAGMAIAVVAAGMLPSGWASLAAWLTGLVLACWSHSRAGERWVARLVLRARPPTPTEHGLLAGPITTLCGQRLGPPAVDVLVVDHRVLAPEGFGRRTVLVPAELITRYRQGWLTEPEVTALLVGAVGFLRCGVTRADGPATVLGLPCLPIRMLAASIGAATSGMVLIRFAWRARVVVLAVAVWRAVTVYGLPWLAVGVGLLGFLSYAAPVAARRALRMMQLAGDDFTVEAGHQPGLARFLTRFGDDFSVERLHRITPVRPQLSVVH